jgi:hypothetical protein
VFGWIRWYRPFLESGQDGSIRLVLSALLFVIGSVGGTDFLIEQFKFKFDRLNMNLTV